MLKNKRIVIILLIILIALLLLVIRFKPPSTNPADATTPPVAGVAAQTPCSQTASQSSAAAQAWDCSRDGRTVRITGLPDGVTPYTFTFDDASLRKQKTDDSIASIVSIVADIRFLDSNSKIVPTFKEQVKLWMSFNAADLAELPAGKKPSELLIPIQIKPDKENIWRPFPRDSVDYSQMDNATEGGVTITFTTWGDPPTGWGLHR
jgi:hypothetical protein